MRQPGTSRMLPEALLDYLFAGTPRDLAAELRAYCADRLQASPRFRGFAAEHKDKVRKKIRDAGDAERLRDLRLELDTAYRLLQDRRVAVIYEQQAARKARAPDFTATFTSRYTFYVEVKRVRGPSNALRLGDVICAKLGQLLPAAINILVVGIDEHPAEAEAADPARALALLRARAERKEDEFFARRDFHDARDLLRHLQRLSAVVVRTGWMRPDGGTLLLWANTSARRPLPPELRRILES